MTRFRQQADWSRTCEVLAMLHNVNIDPRKTRPVTGSDLNPFGERKPARAQPSGIEALKMFL